MKILLKVPLSPYTGYGNDGIGLTNALLRMGADVYIQPPHIDPPLPPQIAQLLTKRLTPPFDLCIMHTDPLIMDVQPSLAKNCTATVGWTMWEYTRFDHVDEFDHRIKSESWAQRYKSLDLVLCYDDVTQAALYSVLPDTPSTVLQGGFEPLDWPYVERDWFSDRFGFCMVGMLHERKAPFAAIQAFQQLKEEHPDFEGAELHLKGSPYSAKVLTPSGWTTMGALSESDRLIDPVGGDQKVLAIQELGEQDIYQVRLRDGSVAECTADHLWTVKKETGPWRVVRTDELIGTLRRDKHVCWEVPRVTPVEYDPQLDLPLDPYLLGLLLGDGSLSGDVRFGSADGELLEECVSRLPLNVVSVDYGVRTGCRWLGLRGMLPVVRELGIDEHRSWDKFVPSQYLTASSVQRLELLRGLMDTDGTSATKSNSPSFCTVSPQLRDDVCELVRSLGGNAHTHTVKMPYYMEAGEKVVCREAYQIKVVMDVNPFRLSRKAQQWDSKIRKHHVRRRIVSIEFVRREQARCILVSGDNHLYVTNDYVVTHNTQASGLHPGLEEMVPKLRVHYAVWDEATLRAFYGKQHVLLAPSHGEGKNMPALEMLSTGGSAIVTNWGGHTQWLRPDIAHGIDYVLRGEFGFPDSLSARVKVEHLKELMLRVYNNRAEAKKMGELASSYIPQTCSWDAVVEKMFRRLEENIPVLGRKVRDLSLRCQPVHDLNPSRQALAQW